MTFENYLMRLIDTLLCWKNVAGYHTLFCWHKWMRFKVGNKLSGDPSYFWTNLAQAIHSNLALTYMSSLGNGAGAASTGDGRPLLHKAVRAKLVRSWRSLSKILARSANNGRPDCKMGNLGWWESFSDICVNAWFPIRVIGERNAMPEEESMLVHWCYW